MAASGRYSSAIGSSSSTFSFITIALRRFIVIELKDRGFVRPGRLLGPIGRAEVPGLLSWNRWARQSVSWS